MLTFSLAMLNTYSRRQVGPISAAGVVVEGTGHGVKGEGARPEADDRRYGTGPGLLWYDRGGQSIITGTQNCRCGTPGAWPWRAVLVNARGSE